MKLAITFVLAACSLFGQQGSTVAISKGNGNETAFTVFYYYSGSNLQYICKTPAFRGGQNQPFYWAKTPSLGQGTLTSIVVSSNVATATVTSDHGFDLTRSLGALVTVSGSTTAALNGNYTIATLASTTVFTFTTSGVADGTYNTALLKIATTAPRLNATPGYWSVEQFVYDGSNNMIADKMATASVAGNTATNAYAFKCSDRATLAYQ